MFSEIKNKIEKELNAYINSLDKQYSLNKISPLLFNSIKEFLCRRGKRIRPILFTVGYLGFAGKPVSGLYRSAISLELLHDFMLVHDDIIDKSDTRRGIPSMHIMFDKYLSRHKNIKFNGQDLTIVAGDVMFALALEAFLSVKEKPQRKERALRKLIGAALYTGSGEFLELLNGIKGLNELSRDDIYRTYDLKTANYTFASPLSIGAILAGAPAGEINKLFKYGIYVGRAFQIKDDIIGLFSDESEIGKPNLTDLEEGKRTILIWNAYKNCAKKDRLFIKKLFSKNSVSRQDLSEMRRIVYQSGSLDYAKKQMEICVNKACEIIRVSRLEQDYKLNLAEYIDGLLKL